MFVVRGGRPKVIRKTAPQRPAGTPTATETLQAKFLDKQPTIWARIRNLSATNALRIYNFEDDYLNNRNYIELDAGPGSAASILEGPFEFNEMWIVGVGAAVDFDATLAIRIA